WAVPLCLLAGFAWYRPDTAFPVLAVLTGLLVAVDVWAAASSDSWRSFEDDHGPVRTLASFVLIGALGLLGAKRPSAGGLLLTLVGVLPLVVSVVVGGERLHSGSLTAVSSPALLAGVLYLISGSLARHQDGPAPRDLHHTTH
ncbi:MAG: hypothetical protein WCD35_06015, partial [Mycobacteriales bacterium]